MQHCPLEDETALPSRQVDVWQALTVPPAHGQVSGTPRESVQPFYPWLNSTQQLLSLYDLNGPVLGIYNRDHDYRVSLLNRSAPQLLPLPCC